MARSVRELIPPFARGFLLLGLFLLAQPSASAAGADSSRDRGSVAQAHAHKTTYHGSLAAPGHMVRNVENFQKGLYTGTLRNLTRLLGYGAGSVNTPLWSTGAASIVDDIEDGVSFFNALVTSLEKVARPKNSTNHCVVDIGRVLIGMVEGRGWALRFLDAMGKPGPGLSEFRLNFVGDYALCRSLEVPFGSGAKSFRGNYCTLSVALGPINPSNPLASPMMKLGVCLPDSCTDTQITQLVSEAIHLAGLNGSLRALPAESHTDKREATAATYASVVFICIIFILMVMGTVYDVIFLQLPVWRARWTELETAEKNINTDPGDGGGTQAADDEPMLLKSEVQKSPKTSPRGKLGQTLLAFSVYTNGSKVLNTSQAPGAITCIHGIRFLSMTWVILGHMANSSMAFSDNVATEIPTLFRKKAFDAVSNGFLSVDTFFALSGFLVAYLTVSEMKKKGWKLKWGLFYFHRFWRLTPPYMLVLLLALGLQRYFGEGALWSPTQPEDRENCERYWWTNLLYINNLVHMDAQCMGHTWYLANDLQFFALSPLMMIPFYFNPLLGSASCLLFLLTTMITTGALSAQAHWPATLVSAAAQNRFNTYFFDYYVTPWCRIGPYVVGIWTGCLIASKKNKLKLTMPQALIGWAVAGATALATLYGLHGDIAQTDISSVRVAALYNAVARSAWGAAICWIIVACMTGWGGFVNTLLSWSPFVVLGRLTYMAYLIHRNLMHIYFENMETLMHLTVLNLILNFTGFLVVIYGVSFVVMLALESPMVGLEKVLLPRPRKD